MRSRWIFPLIVSALALSAAAPAGTKAPAQQGRQLIGKAPKFSAKTIDEKSYDLAGLTKDGTAYLFFIKKDCPITAGAMQFYTAIGKAYGAKAHLLGVFSGNADEYKAYNKEHKLTFPTVLDPDMKMISSYKVETSPWVIEVKADGTVGRTWRGYSQEFLQQINKGLADSAKVAVAKVDFSDAPTDARYG